MLRIFSDASSRLSETLRCSVFGWPFFLWSTLTSAHIGTFRKPFCVSPGRLANDCQRLSRKLGLVSIPLPLGSPSGSSLPSFTGIGHLTFTDPLTSSCRPVTHRRPIVTISRRHPQMASSLPVRVTCRPFRRPRGRPRIVPSARLACAVSPGALYLSVTLYISLLWRHNPARRPSRQPSVSIRACPSARSLLQLSSTSCSCSRRCLDAATLLRHHLPHQRSGKARC
ncbi:hypothetical protein OE88DRAFT_394361 [Heliocybe sulcata]|uniref:Uncharacterized protein n=1 Tax=Heliocybe sulcata TaxID=5364 RepID=A0A5C3MYB5_9AGAM|nr:hypothetical protein OE88DRAFT_394361 [Heliocybe sulcata]